MEAVEEWGQQRKERRANEKKALKRGKWRKFFKYLIRTFQTQMRGGSGEEMAVPHALC